MLTLSLARSDSHFLSLAQVVSLSLSLLLFSTGIYERCTHANQLTESSDSVSPPSVNQLIVTPVMNHLNEGPVPVEAVNGGSRAR